MAQRWAAEDRRSERSVPLWPQPKEVLEHYLETYRHDLPGVLFPSPHVSEDRPLTDLRDLLDRVAVRAGFLAPVLEPATGEQRRTASSRPVWGGRRIRTRIFRQTYCAARLQTLDRGQPVSLYTVSRELGHDSEDMVRRVYARLGKIRHRVEAVEFRPEQWFDEIDGQLVPREGRKRGYHTGGQGLELGSGKQRPALFSRTIAGS